VEESDVSNDVTHESNVMDITGVFIKGL
jgi:hypothetical protein